jgi:type IV secretory pathway VirB6-like protein
MISFPLQTTTGDMEIVVLLFISFLVAVVLSLVLGVKGVRSYRASHDRGIALLTVGILLLSGVAASINVALSMFTVVPGWVVTTAGNLARLLGIVIIIVTIYDQ